MLPCLRAVSGYWASGQESGHPTARCRSHLEQAERMLKGVFCAIINFSPGSYVFQPSEAAVLEELNNGTMEGIIAVAHSAPRLLHMRAFAQHFEVR